MVSREDAISIYVKQQFYAHEHTLGNLKRIQNWMVQRDYCIPAELRECVAAMNQAIESLQCAFDQDDHIVTWIQLRVEERRERERENAGVAFIETKAERKQRLDDEKNANQQ